MRLDNEMDFSLSDINTERIKLLNRAWGKIREEDPDPVGSVDFWPPDPVPFHRIRIVPVTTDLLNKHKMTVYNIEFYAYLPII